LKLQEFQVAEAIHCPSCSTRYRLRAERLRPAIRRARCFSCGGVFPVGDVVQRLLAEAPAATASFGREVVDAALNHAPMAPPAPSSLTLGDLEGVDSEILEKTLVDLPSALPETKIEAIPAPPSPAPAPIVPEAGESTLTGSYSSARDAIDKLFAGAPAVAQSAKVPRDPSAMDMEATLSALEATLGGASLSTPQPDSDTPTASGRLPGIGQTPATATVRLSQEDLRAALRAGNPEEPSPSPLRTIPEEAQPEPAPAFVHAQVPEPVAGEDPGAEQLRLKIGEEVYPGLTMTQLAAWVEEGRILEHHLVARQHSENWLEAHKVPGLRPVFERQRRERSGSSPILDPSSPDPAHKKSLFGGLFGKG
jgi:predicted Zn finger-like uncharacterized protein